jgi:hypothetical protein
MQKQKEKNTLWENYWRERHKSLQNPLGKRRAVTAAFRLLKKLARELERPVRIIELGCGEGHILGELFKMCAADKVPVKGWVGIDNQANAVEKARQLYPHISFSVADYARQALNLETFDIVMLIGTLHEVYSSSRSTILREIDHTLGKKAVKKALCHSVHLVRDNGYVVLFDGVEHSLTPDSKITITIQSIDARNEFKKFASEYEAFRIDYEELEAGRRIRISMHNFTRYITKTRFINNSLWEIEKRESYQYFNEEEFRKYLGDLGLKVLELHSSSPYQRNWQNRVIIETPGVDFPKENILIVARRTQRAKGLASLNAQDRNH